MDKKIWKIKFIFEFEEEFPANWTAEDVEFYFNESSHCATSELNRLIEINEKVGCVCGCTYCEVEEKK